MIIDLNWFDPDNSAQYFNGNDIVSFYYSGIESVEWLSFDSNNNGQLFLTRTPDNNDAGSTTILMGLVDDRPTVSMSTEYEVGLELIANDAPQFNNLGNFPETFSPGDTLQFNVDWQDPNDDVISFYVTENWSWFSWSNSGYITVTPTSSHVGSYDIPFNISDGCYTSTAIRTLTIEE